MVSRCSFVLQVNSGTHLATTITGPENRPRSSKGQFKKKMHAAAPQSSSQGDSPLVDQSFPDQDPLPSFDQDPPPSFNQDPPPSSDQVLPPSSEQMRKTEGNESRKTKKPGLISNPPSSKSSPVKKCKTVTGVARRPTPGLRKFDTQHYARYDSHSINLEAVEGAFVSFGKYDRYHLYINPSLQDISEVPTVGVRLDDFTISKVIVAATAKRLNQFWPADFDKMGMIRATRMPLGVAAKVFVNVGDVDLTGEEIFARDEGWYYLWWRGIHLLCGMEGLNADMYKIRPSYEAFATDGLVWLKKYRAVLQTAPEVDFLV